MTRVVAVAGTVGRFGGWWADGSPLWTHLAPLGIVPERLNGKPFEWDTRFSRTSWEYGGKALGYYMAATGADVVLAYSLGGYLPVYAAADGARIRRLLTVGMPARADMNAVERCARPNIDRWWNVLDEDADTMAVLGGNGIEGFARLITDADVNIGIDRHGHGGVLVDPVQFDRWWTPVLSGFLRGECEQPPAHQRGSITV